MNSFSVQINSLIAWLGRACIWTTLVKLHENSKWYASMYWWGRILVQHSQLLLIKMVLIQQFNLPIIPLEVDYWMQLLQISCNRSMLFWPFRRVIIDEVTNIVFALLSLLSMLPLAMFWYVNLQLYSLPVWNLLEYIGDNNLRYCLYTHKIQ